MLEFKQSRLGAAAHLGDAIRDALDQRRTATELPRAAWLASDFAPSSTILDAAISLYGSHDVSAIRGHAASVEDMAACTAAIRGQIDATRAEQDRRIIFLSGAPGAGKTLVGLELAFDDRYREDAVFVTGNAPLVEVLDTALRSSYLRGRRTGALVVASASVASAPPRGTARSWSSMRPSAPTRRGARCWGTRCAIMRPS
ncbi:MAG: DNA/RNA helicase domain-containing protein [Pseudomonadota bacterium]